MLNHFTPYASRFNPKQDHTMYPLLSLIVKMCQIFVIFTIIYIIIMIMSEIYLIYPLICSFREDKLYFKVLLQNYLFTSTKSAMKIFSPGRSAVRILADKITNSLRHVCTASFRQQANSQHSTQEEKQQNKTNLKGPASTSFYQRCAYLYQCYLNLYSLIRSLVQQTTRISFM